MFPPENDQNQLLETKFFYQQSGHRGETIKDGGSDPKTPGFRQSSTVPGEILKMRRTPQAVKNLWGTIMNKMCLKDC